MQFKGVRHREGDALRHKRRWDHRAGDRSVNRGIHSGTPAEIRFVLIAMSKSAMCQLVGRAIYLQGFVFSRQEFVLTRQALRRGTVIAALEAIGKARKWQT